MHLVLNVPSVGAENTFIGEKENEGKDRGEMISRGFGKRGLFLT